MIFKEHTANGLSKDWRNGLAVRDERWSESIAVGSLAFVEKIKSKLGATGRHREFELLGEAYALREESEAYTRNSTAENEFFRPGKHFPVERKR